MTICPEVHWRSNSGILPKWSRGEGVFQHSAARWPEVISAMLGMGERCAVQVHFPYTAGSSSVGGGDGNLGGRDALFGWTSSEKARYRGGEVTVSESQQGSHQITSIKITMISSVLKV